MKVGDRVRFVRDNSNGGADYGRKGQEAIIRQVYESGENVELEEFGDVGFPPDAAMDDLELVEPTLTDGPVHTVTRREVVPGVWSGVVVTENGLAIPNVTLPSNPYTPDELRAAAAVLLELAGALSDGTE